MDILLSATPFFLACFFGPAAKSIGKYQKAKSLYFIHTHMLHRLAFGVGYTYIDATKSLARHGHNTTTKAEAGSGTISSEPCLLLATKVLTFLHMAR